MIDHPETKALFDDGLRRINEVLDDIKSNAKESGIHPYVYAGCLSTILIHCAAIMCHIATMNKEKFLKLAEDCWDQIDKAPKRKS